MARSQRRVTRRPNERDPYAVDEVELRRRQELEKAYWRDSMAERSDGDFLLTTRRRPAVPEDVLVYDRIASIARNLGLDCKLDFYPSLLRRRPFETLYYATLRALPPLQRILPCTMNFHFARA